MCLQWVVASLGLGEFDGDEWLVPKTSGWYIPIESCSPAQIWRSFFEYKRAQNQEFFLMNGKKETITWVYLGSFYVKYSDNDKEQLMRRLKLDQLMIDKFSTSVQRGHVQHEGVRLIGDHVLPYHTYLINQACNLKDAVDSTYVGTVTPMVVHKLLSVHDAMRSSCRSATGLNGKTDKKTKVKGWEWRWIRRW